MHSGRKQGDVRFTDHSLALANTERAAHRQQKRSRSGQVHSKESPKEQASGAKPASNNNARLRTNDFADTAGKRPEQADDSIMRSNVHSTA